MAQIAQQVDLTSLVAALNAMTQTLGLNGKNLVADINTGFAAAKYLHISGAGTFAPPGAAGIVLSMNINTPASGATGTIYDSSTTTLLPGTLIVANVDLAVTIPEMLPIGPGSRGLELNNGLVVVTTGSADITMGYL